jgi:hypothetical protein
MIAKFLLFIFLILNLTSCSKVRKSAGVDRKIIDEFQVVENPPLIIPPDFNLISPDQLEAKNIDDVEKELAKEILYGLDTDNEKSIEQLSTINNVLYKSDALNVPLSIREEIDKEFAQQLETDGIFQVEWNDEFEVLDAIEESKRIRENIFKGKSISEGEVPTKLQIIKKKKKKKFIFF